MDDATKFLLSFEWNRPMVTHILVCQNGLCRHSWTVNTTATPAVACPNCGTTALIVERIEPSTVLTEYMAEFSRSHEAEEPPQEPEPEKERNPEWDG